MSCMSPSPSPLTSSMICGSWSSGTKRAVYHLSTMPIDVVVPRMSARRNLDQVFPSISLIMCHRPASSFLAERYLYRQVSCELKLSHQITLATATEDIPPTKHEIFSERGGVVISPMSISRPPTLFRPITVPLICMSLSHVPR